MNAVGHQVRDARRNPDKDSRSYELNGRQVFGKDRLNFLEQPVAFGIIERCAQPDGQLRRFGAPNRWPVVFCSRFHTCAPSRSSARNPGLAAGSASVAATRK